MAACSDGSGSGGGGGGGGGTGGVTGGGGVTWTALNTGFGTSNIKGIAWGGTAGNEKFVAVGFDGKAAYSADGVTWTAVSDTKFGTSISSIYGIAWGGPAGKQKFVAVGYGGKAAYWDGN